MNLNPYTAEKIKKFKSDPLANLEKSSALLFFIATASVMFTATSIGLDIFNLITEKPIFSNTIRIQPYIFSLPFSLLYTLGMRHRWKEIKRIEGKPHKPILSKKS